MSETKDNKKTNNRKVYVIAVIALVAALAVSLCIVFMRTGNIASTMRLLRVEGTVNVEDAKGGSKPVADNIRFQSGDALSTGSDGLASVGLDDTKIVTLKNDSRAEFVKKGKQLELKLTKGALFFNVTEKLKSDEKFEIKTSTMTAGIRGTSGIVYYDETKGGKESLMVTDGVVEVSATNPDTQETKTARVQAGQKVTLYLYSGRIEDSVEFDVEDIAEYDLSKFTLSMIASNDDLMNRVCNHTGWNKDTLKGLLNDLDKKGVKPTESEPSNTDPTESQPADTSETEPTPTKKPTRKPTKKPTKKPTRKPTKKPRRKRTTQSVASHESGSTVGGPSTR